jgi:hypothetical protein
MEYQKNSIKLKYSIKLMCIKLNLFSGKRQGSFYSSLVEGSYLAFSQKMEYQKNNKIKLKYYVLL